MEDRKWYAVMAKKKKEEGRMWKKRAKRCGRFATEVAVYQAWEDVGGKREAEEKEGNAVAQEGDCRKSIEIPLDAM